MIRKNEYIWYCPRRSCNSIILKTKKPFLVNGKFQCKRCNEILTADILMKSNLHNFRKFIKENG
jgi:hypothetical protein